MQPVPLLSYIACRQSSAAYLNDFFYLPNTFLNKSSLMALMLLAITASNITVIGTSHFWYRFRDEVVLGNMFDVCLSLTVQQLLLYYCVSTITYYCFIRNENKNGCDVSRLVYSCSLMPYNNFWSPFGRV